MIVVPFRAEHLEGMRVQKAQERIVPMINDWKYRRELQSAGVAWSLINEDSLEVIACAGVIDCGFGRGQAWSILSNEANKYLITITKEILKKMDSLSFKRLEITVADGFSQGHRWAKILGFKCDTPNGMECYVDGIKDYLYSRIRWQNL